MHIIDLEGNHYPAQLTYTWEGELNGNQSLSATIKPSKVNLKFIHDISEMWQIVDDDDVAYKIVYSKRKGEGKLLNVDIKAIPLFFDDFNNQRIYERIDQHMTALNYFTMVFDGSGYNVVIVDPFEAIQWEGAGEGATRLEMFKNGLNRYGAEFYISGNAIYLENQIGNDTQFRYEHRLNASNIVQEIDANEFWTYARGYGDYGDGQGGEDWQNAKLIREYTSPLARIPAIGIREAPPIKNGNITTTATMDSQLKIAVDESLKISVSADIHDLRKQGYPIAQSQLGDRVFLVDRRIGFDDEIRVVSMSITKNWKKEIVALNLTFGELNITKRHQSNLNTAIKEIGELFNGRKKLPYNVLDDAVKHATQALISAETELNFENGILAINPNNPNEVVLFNSAGVGISNDGGATFTTAMTGGGVVADVITSGALRTNNVTIIGEDSYFFWDGNALTAIDPNNLNKRVDLTAGMLEIKHGAITIERPDGFKTIIDGYSNANVNVQGATPQFLTTNSEQYQRFIRTQATSKVEFDLYTFRHEARYLKFDLAHYIGTNDWGAYGTIFVDDFKDGTNLYSTDFVNGVGNNNAIVGNIYTVDLGTPTGDLMSVYLRWKTSSDLIWSYIRKRRVWLEG